MSPAELQALPAEAYLTPDAFKTAFDCASEQEAKGLRIAIEFDDRVVIKEAQKAGYTSCACRDCMEVAIGEAGEAYCHDCEEAGCADYQGVRGMPQECQVERYKEDEVDDG